MTSKPAHYVKVPELARRLGVSRSTIWRWAHTDRQLVEVRRLAPRMGVRARVRPTTGKN